MNSAERFHLPVCCWSVWPASSFSFVGTAWNIPTILLITISISLRHAFHLLMNEFNPLPQPIRWIIQLSFVMMKYFPSYQERHYPLQSRQNNNIQEAHLPTKRHINVLTLVVITTSLDHDYNDLSFYLVYFIEIHIVYIVFVIINSCKQTCKPKYTGTVHLSETSVNDYNHKQQESSQRSILSCQSLIYYYYYYHHCLPCNSTSLLPIWTSSNHPTYVN